MAPLDISIDFQDVVLPSLPTQTSTLYLDNIDQQVFFHVEMLFFYHGLGDKRVGSVEFFRSSLSKLLVPYHFAAGRYHVNKQEGRVEVVCNRAGALFAGASSHMSLAELGDFSSPNPEFRKLILYPVRAETIEEIPLLTVQVTEFACGGYVLGFSASHCLFDGVELNNLFNNYSKIVRGDEELHLTLKPVMDKTHLRPASSLEATFPPEAELHVHKELVSLPDIPAKLLFKPTDYSLAGSPVPPGFFYKSFAFTPRMLASLKLKAISDVATEVAMNTCSTFEALAAHIWQCRTKAMHTENEAPSKLFVVIDSRKKLQSLLPAGFAGNSVVAAPCVETISEEVCESSLAWCVKRVQETIRNAGESYIRSQVSWCQGNHGIIDLPGGMLITTWSKLGFDTIDFGTAKPAYVAPVISSRTEYVLVLGNCLGDGGLDVFMAMEFEKMNELEKNLFNI